MRNSEGSLTVILKLNVLAVLCALSLLVLKMAIDNRHTYVQRKAGHCTTIHLRQGGTVHEELDCSSIFEIKKVRNELSNQLNSLKRTVGQMQCEASKLKTNKQGGWCRETSKENSSEHATDKTLLPKLSEFLKDKRVASFGDGPGIYKREIMKLGQVKLYDAFDGSPYCEETSHGRVKFMDLTIPQFGLSLYDWIISLEVAEHIPAQYESVYLDNIFRHAKEGIIFSWAVPGQGGLDHVNDKPKEYPVEIMKIYGFELDSMSSRKLQMFASLPWIKNNINVYVRKNFNNFRSRTRLVNWFL